MDQVSRDALTETKQVLEELAGFLTAVNAALDSGADPLVLKTAEKLAKIAAQVPNQVQVQMQGSIASLEVVPLFRTV